MKFARVVVVAMLFCSLAAACISAQTKAAQEVTALLREFIAGPEAATEHYLKSFLLTM